MKKLILLFLSITFFSCSGDDDSSSSQSNSFFNPPEWIHGKWLVDDLNMTFGFEFTHDNFIIVQTGANINYGEILQMQEDLGVNVSTQEDISDSEYEVKIFIHQGTSTTYRFKKINANTIEFQNTNFYKQ